MVYDLNSKKIGKKGRLSEIFGTLFTIKYALTLHIRNHRGSKYLQCKFSQRWIPNFEETHSATGCR